MNRKDIISKLMNEGLTEKTLVIMTDKQLGMLAKRLIPEQYLTTSSTTTTPSAGSTSILNIPRTDQASINTAKQQKKPFATYESEVKEDMNPKLGAEKKEYSEKDKAIAAANMKIKAAIKDGKDYGDYTRLIKKLNGGELPENTKKIIGSKKETKLNEWVNKVVKKNIQPYTSKQEIMGLIETKLREQHDIEPEVDVLPDFLTYDEITKSAGEPTTVPAPPKTKPGTIPTPKTPKTPYRPGPGINPKPKAEK